MTGPVLTRRALNRATLERQMLLRRSRVPVIDTIEWLVGLQAQTPHTAYVGLWTRLEEFRPDELSQLMVERKVVRMALMRSTIHLVTADDALGLRPLVQPVLSRTQQGQFGRRLQGVDVEEVAAVGRAFVDQEPRTFRALGDHLLERWPGGDRFALEQAVRTYVPLVQVPPRGLWGRSGPIAHTSAGAWLGRSAPPITIDQAVRRYLAAFGPASVMDAQQWSGLTRLREVFDRLRPGLVTFRGEDGRELFDLPDAPRPDADTPAPVRYLYDYENVLLSYRDRSRFIPAELGIGSIIDTGVIYSTFLVDGVVAGLWRIARRGNEAVLELRVTVGLSATEMEDVHDEGARLLEFAAADARSRSISVEPWTAVGR